MSQLPTRCALRSEWSGLKPHSIRSRHYFGLANRLTSPTLVLFLASDEEADINCHDLVVDGGMGPQAAIALIKED